VTGLTERLSSIYTLSAPHNAKLCEASPFSHRRARYGNKGDGFIANFPHLFGGIESIPMGLNVTYQWCGKHSLKFLFATGSPNYREIPCRWPPPDTSGRKRPDQYDPSPGAM
jgi:hypothetical protein